MKTYQKIFCTVFAVLFCLLTPTALAETQEEFELNCMKKTATACTVYDWVRGLDDYSNYDFITGPKTVVANIPAGTYVHCYDKLKDGWIKIEFYFNGQKMRGLANVELVNTTSVVRRGGIAYDVHENDPDYEAKMAQGTVERDVRAGWTTYLYDYDGSEGDLEKVSKEEAAQRSSTYTAGSAQNPSETKETPEQQSANVSTVPVEVLTLGTAESTIRYDGQERTVKTSELDFSAKDVPAEKAVAVVYAPRTGQASLRSKANGGGSLIRKCKAGTVVSVLEIKGDYSLVNVKGDVGYMRNDCLQYYPAAPETEGTAQLSYNGKTNGSTTINVRNAASGDSAKVAEWETGTEVTVFGRKDGWVEIEAKGVHGWVLEKYVTQAAKE